MRRLLICRFMHSPWAKELGVHSKRVPSFVLPESQVQTMSKEGGYCSDLTCRNMLQPGKTIEEMATAEPCLYLRHDVDSIHTLPDFSAKMAKSLVEVG